MWLFAHHCMCLLSGFVGSKCFLIHVAPLIYGGICHDCSSVATNIVCQVHVVHHLVDKRYFFLDSTLLFIYFHFSSSVISLG